MERFAEKVATLWGTTPDQVLSWVKLFITRMRGSEADRKRLQRAEGTSAAGLALRGEAIELKVELAASKKEVEMRTWQVRVLV